MRKVTPNTWVTLDGVVQVWNAARRLARQTARPRPVVQPAEGSPAPLPEASGNGRFHTDIDEKDFPMTDQPTEPNVSAIRDTARPAVADRAAFQTELDRLRVREKAHTREGDAIAAARRRLPMVEVDPQTPLTGADGLVPLIDIFDGRSQLIAYFHMWHTGRPAAEQCEGCTFNTSHITELAYLHSRDVSYAVLSEGPYEEASRYREFMGYPVPWYSVPPDSVDRLIADRYFGILACYLRDGGQVYETYWTSGRGNEAMAPSYGLLDRTVYGRQELWEDSPEGWPQRWGSKGGQFRLDTDGPAEVAEAAVEAIRHGPNHGRPMAQQSRIQAGRDDDLGPMPEGWTACSCPLHPGQPAAATN
jgi:predicted dithiol-disulfide oxidoreductase (DUF899 family)